MFEQPLQGEGKYVKIPFVIGNKYISSNSNNILISSVVEKVLQYMDEL